MIEANPNLAPRRCACNVNPPDAKAVAAHATRIALAMVDEMDNSRAIPALCGAVTALEGALAVLYATDRDLTARNRSVYWRRCMPTVHALRKSLQAKLDALIAAPLTNSEDAAAVARAALAQPTANNDTATTLFRLVARYLLEAVDNEHC